MHFLHTLVIAVSIFGAASAAQQSYAPPGTAGETPPLSLALEYENGDVQPERETASLQIRVPAATREFREDNRRCMTFCSSWGEDCVLHNAGTDHVSKKCVRTCKSFAEECL